MDILVLDAPMKYIHGKMVEQGAQEWSRYLASQFNPIGRGTLYSEEFDREQGLRVYLYSPSITLECVGENKGYLKVVKAEETDVLTYHKVIEEGKLLEEKITFVPVYKFQYINGKEHYDVERFMQVEKDKRDLENYIHSLEALLENYKDLDEVATQVIRQEQVRNAISCLYKGQATNPQMKDFLPELEGLKSFEEKVFQKEDFTLHYDRLSEVQKKIINQALSTEDLYFVQTKTDETVPLVREILQQGVSTGNKMLVVAPNEQEVDKILSDLEKETTVHAVHLQQGLEHKAQIIKERTLSKLNNEASKHNKHKEELEHMKAECDLYQNADKTIKICFDILALLEDIHMETLEIQKESQELGNQGIKYIEDLEKYEAIPEEELKVYQKLKECLSEDENLYDELIWMKVHQEAIEYQVYKDLIIGYSEEVQVFEEQVKAYQMQISEQKRYEEECRIVETKILELRRQHLKTEALKQVDRIGTIESDETILSEIKVLEQELLELKKAENAMKIGHISTRYLDELKASVYGLKAKVEAYIEAHRFELSSIYEKEEITKAEVIDIFKRMQKVEALFSEDNEYMNYLEGIENYLSLEVTIQKNNKLIRLQEENQKKMGNILTKQTETISLLSTKLEEQGFKDFLKVIDEDEQVIMQLLREPLNEESRLILERLEDAVQKRAFKLEIYKEKVAFYEELAKLKEDWKQGLLEEECIITQYLKKQTNVIGTTCASLASSLDKNLTHEVFDYVVMSHAEQIKGLEMLIPMTRGKRVIFLGNSGVEKGSLFAKLYDKCPQSHKALVTLEG